MINGLGLLPQLPLLLGLSGGQPLVRWMMVEPGPAPRSVMPLLSRIKLPSLTVNVPAASDTTSPAGHELIAFWMLLVSSEPPPIGLIVAQTVLRLSGMPPAACIPAMSKLT